MSYSQKKRLRWCFIMCAGIWKYVRVGIIHDHASSMLKMINFENLWLNFVIFGLKIAQVLWMMILDVNLNWE